MLWLWLEVEITNGSVLVKGREQLVPHGKGVLSPFVQEGSSASSNLGVSSWSVHQAVVLPPFPGPLDLHLHEKVS